MYIYLYIYTHTHAHTHIHTYKRMEEAVHIGNNPTLGRCKWGKSDKIKATSFHGLQRDAQKRGSWSRASIQVANGNQRPVTVGGGPPDTAGGGAGCFSERLFVVHSQVTRDLHSSCTLARSLSPPFPRWHFVPLL